MPRYCFFFLQSSRYVSNEQPCLKTTGLYEDLLRVSSSFHFFYFIFSLPLHLVYVFRFLQLLFLMFFLKSLSSIVEKLLYTYIEIIYIIYIFRKLKNFILTKTFMHFDSTCWTQYEQNARSLIKKIGMQQATKVYCRAQGTIVNIL